MKVNLPKTSILVNSLSVSDFNKDTVYQNISDSDVYCYINSDDDDYYYLISCNTFVTFDDDYSSVLDYLRERNIADCWRETNLKLTLTLE